MNEIRERATKELAFELKNISNDEIEDLFLLDEFEEIELQRVIFTYTHLEW